MDIKSIIDRIKDLAINGVNMDNIKDLAQKGVNMYANKLFNDLKKTKVVYDGDSAKAAAWNLCKYLDEIGHPASFWDADKYRDEGAGYGKVIIVGHHSLAKDTLKNVGILKYDQYGMKYGFDGNLCVLRASRSELKRKCGGKEMFGTYYENRLIAHEKLSSKFNIPATTGLRVSTRDSQYDLLILEFITFGLSKFLGLKDTQNSKEENVEKMKATNLKKIEERYKNDIKRYWKSDFVFTDALHDDQNVHELDKDELLTGEFAAYTFTVGCYTVRSAKRVYEILENGDGEVPADINAVLTPGYDKEGKIIQEISAKHNTDPNQAFADGFKYVCRAEESAAWSETIKCICTIKENCSLSDETASLFVLVHNMGSSFSVDNWYILDPHGDITTLKIHPFDNGKDE